MTTVTKRDYYEVLSVSRDADDKSIKAAYRKLAQKFHPDRNPGDAEAEERFKEAAESYAVLSDGDKRSRYDRFGHQGVEGVGAQGFDPSVFGDFSDILGGIFGFSDLGGRNPSGPAPGADLRYDLEITFEEAAFGHSTVLKFPRLEACSACKGTGGENGAQPETCSGCKGRGQVRYQQGFLTVARTCPRCGGSGKTVKNPCHTCSGEGRVEVERTVEVKIPAGVDTGSRLRLTGEGEQGRRGGRRGDLYVVLHVAAHETFERDGADVWSVLELSYAQAALGAELEVETLHGPVELDVPAGTQPGREFRLRGKGIPRLGSSGKGDHHVRAAIVVPEPKSLSAEQTELLRRLAELDGKPVRADKGVLDKVRDLFG
ncbi:MAG: molecular chaperone DnaJ [Acidobacteriota bacterium]